MQTTPPGWLAEFANDVALQLYAVDVLAPLGCHYYHNRALDQWEVTLFASQTEICGGRMDGKFEESGFHLDLENVRGLFDEVVNFHWQAKRLGPADDLGPHVSVEGTYCGFSVWLRVLASPPPQFEKGRNAIALEHRLEDVW